MKAFRELHGEPDHIEVLFCGTKEAVLKAEEDALRGFELHKRSDWLNRAVTASEWSGDKISGEKISAKLKGRRKSPEHRARIAAAAKGKKRSMEAIEKTRAAHLGRKCTDEARKR
ncbi:hypothetical protein MOP88_14580 [Sphingomonas sp. WKB10]|nr:hypothetical protein [Sphingomonas sp. WKB10]